MNIEEVLRRCKKTHGDTYDYSKADKMLENNKILIICRTHGPFKQRFDSHTSGSGCPMCGQIKSKTKQKKRTTEEFVQQAKKLHGETYCYDNTVYINKRTKLTITCRKHGDFIQSPWVHLNTNGCGACARDRSKKGLARFIEDARKKHGDRYDYSEAVYTNYQEKIKIICKDHGVFNQTVGNHLSGHGCPVCAMLLSGVGENELNVFTPYLRNLTTDFYVQYPVWREDGRCYHADFFIPKINLVVEYDEHHHYSKKQKDDDEQREKHIKQLLGCDIIRIDDKEFMKSKVYADEIFKKYFDINTYIDVDELFD